MTTVEKIEELTLAIKRGGQSLLEVSSRNKQVVIDFGVQVTWLGMSPREAKKLAMDLYYQAERIEFKKTLGEKNEH